MSNNFLENVTVNLHRHHPKNGVITFVIYFSTSDFYINIFGDMLEVFRGKKSAK